MNDLTLFDAFMNTLYDVLPDFGTEKSVPDTDMKKDKDAYMLEIDLPGLNEKDVNLELDHNILTVSSHNEENKSGKNDENKWIIRERRTNGFKRLFALPEDANTDKASAVFKNGVLSVKIPRKVLATPKRIAIEAA